jgi:hypothetical protein
MYKTYLKLKSNSQWWHEEEIKIKGRLGLLRQSQPCKKKMEKGYFQLLRWPYRTQEGIFYALKSCRGNLWQRTSSRRSWERKTLSESFSHGSHVYCPGKRRHSAHNFGITNPVKPLGSRLQCHCFTCLTDWVSKWRLKR